MDAVVNAVVTCTEGVASWGQEKTKIVRQKLEDKFNVYKDEEYIEELENIDPKSVQVNRGEYMWMRRYLHYVYAWAFSARTC